MCARRYTNIHVGRPQVEEDFVTEEVTPQACRLRDKTYAAPISVDVEYMRGRDKVLKSGVFIGRMPLMLRSDRCAFGCFIFGWGGVPPLTRLHVAVDRTPREHALWHAGCQLS
jgi:DNA-directed RNA polymerase beta subunit